MTEDLKYNEKALARFAEERDLMLLILYGSRATGDADKDSDWDVAVAFKHGKRPANWLGVFTGLGDFFDREIDFAEVSSESDPLFRWEVYRDGKPLYEDESGRFDREFFAAQKVYWDTEKFRWMERQIIEKL